MQTGKLRLESLRQWFKGLRLVTFSIHHPFPDTVQCHLLLFGFLKSDQIYPMSPSLSPPVLIRSCTSLLPLLSFSLAEPWAQQTERTPIKGSVKLNWNPRRSLFSGDYVTYVSGIIGTWLLFQFGIQLNWNITLHLLGSGEWDKINKWCIFSLAVSKWIELYIFLLWALYF